MVKRHVESVEEAEHSVAKHTEPGAATMQGEQEKSFTSTDLEDSERRYMEGFEVTEENRDMMCLC